MTTSTDNNGMVSPVRPRRMNHNTLPRAGSNHMGKVRRELVNCFNDTVVSGRHVQEFYDLVLAVTKETKAFMDEDVKYKKDQAQLAEQLAEHDETYRLAVKQAKVLEAEQNPLAKVLTFTVRSQLDKWAEGMGIKLDARKDIAFMQTDFIAKYTEQKEPKSASPVAQPTAKDKV